MHKRLIGLAAVAVLALTGCGGGGDGDQQTLVRYASVGGLTDAPLYLAEALGFFADEGLKVENTRMPNAAALATAIATGNLDVSAVSTAPAMFNSIAEGVSLKLVADKQSNQGEKGFGLKLIAKDTYVAKKDAGEGGHAIRGARVAVSARNTASDKILMDLLGHWGLSDRDITVIELPYPDMAAALQSDRVDAAIALEPFLVRILQADSSLKVFSDLSEVVPIGAPIVPLVYAEQFLTDQDTGDAFMRAYLRGSGVVNQVFAGEHPDSDKLLATIAEQAGLTADIVKDAQPPGNNPCVPLDVTWIKQAQEFFAERGAVQKPIDVDGITDNAYGDRARAALKAKGQLDFCAG
ncbi:ABC transporter substrate-binding protein [Pseudonocardia sp. NPDC049635]|uniref:ABC transporter substrate-binding protein n=1 Tax=Pseudonocardia sp. NPDC049635 TaxID=3155506 RepID=UPI0033E6B5C7